jgi:fatty-acyl-CoA synthase
VLFMQNSPQFVIAYYGILRANAVVVPLNPMYLTQEFLRCRQGRGRRHGDRVAGTVPARRAAARRGELKQVIVAAYSDYLKHATDLACRSSSRRRARSFRDPA